MAVVNIKSLHSHSITVRVGFIEIFKLCFFLNLDLAGKKAQNHIIASDTTLFTYSATVNSC